MSTIILTFNSVDEILLLTYTIRLKATKHISCLLITERVVISFKSAWLYVALFIILYKGPLEDKIYS